MEVTAGMSGTGGAADKTEVPLWTPEASTCLAVLAAGEEEASLLSKEVFRTRLADEVTVSGFKPMCPDVAPPLVVTGIGPP